MKQNRPRIGDFLSLLMTYLARLSKPNLSASNYDAFYEAFFARKDLEAASQDHRRLTRRSEIRRYFSESICTDSRILDVGCGVGEVLAELEDYPFRFGMEYSPVTQKMACEFLGNSVKIMQGSLYQLPFESDSMDVCICLEVIEHLEEENTALSELNRVIRPSGRLMISVPYTYYWSAYKGLIGHYRHYSRESLVSLLRSSGFEPESYLRNYPQWHRKYANGYFLIALLAKLIGRFCGRPSPYTLRWPWSKMTLISHLNMHLGSLFEREAHLDYSTLQTSTFVVAKKVLRT